MTRPTFDSSKNMSIVLLELYLSHSQSLAYKKHMLNKKRETYEMIVSRQENVMADGRYRRPGVSLTEVTKGTV